MSNALWIRRMCEYQRSAHAVPSAQIVIEIKNTRRNALLKRYSAIAPKEKGHLLRPKTMNDVLLYEARTAKHFWKSFHAPTPSWTRFPGRRPRASDIGNKMLDIGYHHITNYTKKLIEKQNVEVAMGLLHTPRKTTGAPLAYDLVELFRGDLVEAETLRYLRMRKRPIAELGQKDIGKFLHRINTRMEKQFYLRDFKQCHTYRYCMELQILKFIKAVNHKELFDPIILPTRNEDRCS